jgi:uncharacterized membrane protein SpoIIM required for sporulation/uncharacterized RDD family membrane protein YckC
MSSTADTTPAPLSQTLDVETPELVVLSYTLAGVGSRAVAALMDAVICLLLLIGILFLWKLVAAGTHLSQLPASAAWVLGVAVLAQFAILWGYYVLFEALADGQTPGKRALHLRVVRDGGYSITFGASVVRNLVRIVDMQPGPTYGVGMVSVMFSRSGKRLGDYAAGTVVVRESPTAAPTSPHAAQPASELPVLHTRLSEDEYQLLDRFVARSRELPAERRQQLSAQLALRFAAVVAGIDGSTDVARLHRLLEAERMARRAGLAARGETGAARERHAIIATGSPRWTAFAVQLRVARERGLSALGEDGVREFVQGYRDLAADLARLSTAVHGRESAELFYLNRLVAGAHNLLYRRRAIPAHEIVHLLARDVPREIRRSVRPIALAAALLFLPAIIAGTAVYREPDVARLLLPSRMLDRAEEGVARARSGEGYIPDPQVFRPVMATSVIANNVQVTFATFAAGMTAGLGTVWLLLANGISIGAVVGLYASKGIAALLFAFVAPHGVLELSAICIGGGAGFLLAAALLIPGDRTRRRALMENGRRAARLIAGSSLLLVVAGALEGFVSPIEWWPLSVKLAVSAVTAVALVEYLRLGREAPPTAAVVSERPAPLDFEVSIDDARGHDAG